MGLYINNECKQLILNGIIYWVNIARQSTDTNDLKMTSSDGYDLVDSNDVYLICKEDE